MIDRTTTQRMWMLFLIFSSSLAFAEPVEEPPLQTLTERPKSSPVSAAELTAYRPKFRIRILRVKLIGENVEIVDQYRKEELPASTALDTDHEQRNSIGNADPAERSWKEVPRNIALSEIAAYRGGLKLTSKQVRELLPKFKFLPVMYQEKQSSGLCKEFLTDQDENSLVLVVPYPVPQLREVNRVNEPKNRLEKSAQNVPAPRDSDKVALTPEEAQVLEKTNQQRMEAGLQPLKVNPRLMEAARSHTRRMVKEKQLSHEFDDKGPADRIKDAGYVFGSCGENVAQGQTTSEEVVASWMKSEGHRENILNPDYTEIGIGFGTGADGPFWTQVLARPR